MQRKIFIYILMLFPAITNAQNSKMTLKECIAYALEHNVQVKQSELQQQTAEVNWKQAKANQLPNLNGNASQGMSFGRSIDVVSNDYVNQQINSANYGLSSSTILFNGLQLQNTIKQAAYLLSANRMEYEQDKNTLTLNVILAYLLVLNNEDILVLNTQQATVTREQVRLLDIRMKEGAIATATLYDLKGQLAADEMLILNAGNALETSKINLAQLLNLPDYRSLQLERTGIDTEIKKYMTAVAEIIETANTQFPLMKSSEYRTKAAMQFVKVAKSGFYPQLSFNASAGTTYSSVASNFIPGSSSFAQTEDYVIVNGNKSNLFVKDQQFIKQSIGYGKQINNNLNQYIGLNMRIPIFNSFSTKNRVTLAKIASKNADYEMLNNRLLLKQAIEQAYLNMETSYNRHSILEQQIAAYQESFRAAEIRFNAGAGTVVEYIIAKNNYDRARINYTQATYDYLFRTRILDFYKGSL